MEGVTREQLQEWCNKALDRGDYKEADLLRDIIGCCKELNPRRAINGNTPISKVIVLHFANNKSCAGFYDIVKRDWHLFAAYRDESPTHWEYLPGDSV